jgi:gamma-glutamyltranspeptidase/glutathione hydrolase
MPLFGAPEPITIPGAVDAFCRLSEDHGRLGLDAVLAPVIHYAEAGVPVAPRAAFDWMNHHGNLSGRARDYYLVDGASALPGAAVPPAGSGRGAAQDRGAGPRGFYEGEVAEDMVASLQAIGGVHTLEDFANGPGRTTPQPVSGHYKGVELVEHPPNGQGATAILLNHILAEFDIASMDPWGTLRAHIEAEATKLAYATRDGSSPIPITSPACRRCWTPRPARRLRRRSTRPGHALPAASDRKPHKETVYLTVVDRDRMAVSIIYSIFKDFGSGVASDKFGILFHNRGAGFRLDEGHPNEAGAASARCTRSFPPC